MLAIPCTYLVFSIALGRLTPAIDRAVESRLSAGVGIAAARDILSSLATGMIAFTGLVVASVLVAVQFAAGQYSPRLVLWFRRDPIVLNAIGSFLAAPLFALVALGELERQQVTYTTDVTVITSLALLPRCCFWRCCSASSTGCGHGRCTRGSRARGFARRARSTPWRSPAQTRHPLHRPAGGRQAHTNCRYAGAQES
jgi:hypothetical protein